MTVSDPSGASVRRIEPLAGDWRTQSWAGAAFDAGEREQTPVVEGLIRTSRHVVMATLRGGARRLETRSDCGHRYEGSDFPGAVSFVPAGCGRHLAMQDVSAAWASVAFDPVLMTDRRGRQIAPGAFTNVEDPWIAATLSTFSTLHSRDGEIDPLYAETLTLALVQHLIQRHDPAVTAAPLILTRRDLKRIDDHVQANIQSTLRIAELADLVGLSPGYFHRAFRKSTGRTPLEFIQGRRIERARPMLETGHDSIASIALAVGFSDPSHFSRWFRRLTGLAPSALKRSVRRA